MKDHLKRKIEYSIDAIPDSGTNEYEILSKSYDKMILNNPELQKVLDKKHEAALRTLEIQNDNSAGLALNSELRYYLNEFNYRTWQHGLGKMPSMFNVMEAFYKLNKEINCWELLDEEDYIISFFDFLDFYTSNTLQFDIDDLKNQFSDSLIYNYNIGADLKEITFKTDDGKEFVIGGVSIVRRNNEINFLFLAGEITDTIEITRVLKKSLKEISSNYRPVKGREELQFSPDREIEAVRLNEDAGLWKQLITCRFDLETQTIDARYVAADQGNSFLITSDDITSLVRNGQWIDKVLEKTYEESLIKLEGYNSIFELAKITLFLPHFITAYEHDMKVEDKETEAKDRLTNILTKSKYKNVDNRIKLRSRPIWLMNRESVFSSDQIRLRDDKFKIDTSGYWKELEADEIGTDKKDRSIVGRTWVNKTETYYLAKQEDLIVSKTEKPKEYSNKEAGWIYILRNAAFEENVYKIGYTTKETKERARQLSKTSVPDHFYVMREWNVKNCRLAESEIHDLLKIYRLDPRREFFKVNLNIANDIIDKVVEHINDETTG